MRAPSSLATFVLSVALLLGLVLSAPSMRRTPYDPLTAGMPVTRIAVVGDSYTNGTAIGGQGPNAWPVRAWKTLGKEGLPVVADVAAEGRAGYGVRGDQGNLFVDLTAMAVKPDDALVVFYGSRNDQGVDPNVLGGQIFSALSLARGIAPGAKLLVIGPPWPTPDVPPGILQVRDTLAFQSMLAGATFIDPIVAGWFMDRPDLIGKDGVHPTDAGHVYQADKIAPLIGAQLPRRV
ncbi:Rv0518 family GDSL lipase [Mycolicibacterium sp. 050158]|jgi:GDSL-like Lipase/Acylhydrolase family|uniref:Rv0518 family GDSL lipase n=1 Tax=Mycolicibacterium sp. 050158 TaxID=3090602 RepID=UPI00299D6589|nr:GDSL lipase [Mycolicibacterium sp. 050158]MDX1891777.1 SGNH/GDSL hydrolase family protein [Mycolicibacterium sp. 050158]